MRKIAYIYMFFILHAGCEINQKEFKPQDEFVKIYNDADEALTWYPVGIIQTTDKGFLILNAVKSDTSVIEYPTASIIKINAFGEVVNTAATTWLAPAPGLINVGGNYAFVAMDAQNKASLVYVNPDNAEPTETVDLDITMPLSCINDEQGRSVILGYDYISRNSIVAVYNSSTALINKSELNVKEDMMAQVQYHMNKTGSDLPFFIGEWQNDSQKGYFVNCLANYTLRTIFFDENVTPVGGDIFSFQDRDALSSLINLNGNNYAFTRYYGGNNYISTNVEVDPTSSQNFNDLVQNKLTELIPNAKVTGKKVVFSDTEYLLFASTTNSNSIVIYQYTAEGSEEPVRTKYFDFENKIEVVDMIQDINDEGIVVLARTYLTGKYLRPIVMKFKKSDFVN